MPRIVVLGAVLMTSLLASGSTIQAQLRVGFGHADITPKIHPDKSVWLAGYGFGRKATGIHDPLFARCIVLQEADHRIALVSVDLVGLQLTEVRRVRKKLSGFQYVMISSTHNHEGPDVVGIWGQNPAHRGVDDLYLEMVVEKITTLIQETSRQLVPVRARFGTARDDTLLRDSRQPYVKDGIFRALRFNRIDNGKMAGMLLQWSCHPEALGSRNTLVTADFPAATISTLQKKNQCPVVYMSGSVGGLMTPPRDRIRNDEGKVLGSGDFEYARRYGIEVARLAQQALDKAHAIELTPFQVSQRVVTIPLENKLYQSARSLGVLRRPAYRWTGDFHEIGKPATLLNPLQSLAVETEVGTLRLGELQVACIPGEIYPELVYGKFQQPAAEGVDFPTATLEPFVSRIFKQGDWMLFGLANDEVGYIIPRRQWDSRAPFAYGRTRSQYGEINSCGVETARVIMQSLQEQVQEFSKTDRPPSGS